MSYALLHQARYNRALFTPISKPHIAILGIMTEFGIQNLVFVFVGIILSMSVHEAMHAYVGHWLGDTTAKDEGRLTLNPIKHIDLITTVLLPLVLIIFGAVPFFAAKPVPFNPHRVRYQEFGAALIGIAGPFTNLVLAIISGLALRFFVVGMDEVVAQFIATFCQVNIGFFLFNMIPFPPLDGSRLLYAFAPEPLQQLMRTIESYGFAAILAFVFLLYPFLSPVVSNLYGKIFYLLIGV